MLIFNCFQDSIQFVGTHIRLHERCPGLQLCQGIFRVFYYADDGHPGLAFQGGEPYFFRGGGYDSIQAAEPGTGDQGMDLIGCVFVRETQEDRGMMLVTQAQTD